MLPTTSMGMTESMPAVRFLLFTGVAPSCSSIIPTGDLEIVGRPNQSDRNPIRIGELMSPNRWIRKIPRAEAAARWLAGTTLAVTVLQGPRVEASKTIAKNIRVSDDRT